MKRLKSLPRYDVESLLELIWHTVDHYNKSQEWKRKLHEIASSDSSNEAIADCRDNYLRYDEEHRLDMSELECRWEELYPKLYG